jgi:hypothetical protein
VSGSADRAATASVLSTTVTTIVAVDRDAATGFSEGQQSGRLSAQPIMGTSISDPSGRVTSVYSGIVHVPVRRGPPVYGVVGKAMEYAL